jgi:uncharacterized repeat protein (TIGR04138 family)
MKSLGKCCGGDLSPREAIISELHQVFALMAGCGSTEGVASCALMVGVLTQCESIMKDPDFPEIVGLICKEDARFDRMAYDFIRLGLDHTVKELKKKEAGRVGPARHVTGQELLEGLRVYALEQYGPMATTVLNSWGIRRCADFGELVFNLIEYNIFSKTETDRREDFSELYSFEDAFVKPFLPAKPIRGAISSETVEST